MAPITTIAPSKGGGKSVFVFTVAWWRTGICCEKCLKNKRMRMFIIGKEGKTNEPL